MDLFLKKDILWNGSMARNTVKTERLLAIIAIFTIILAWIIGYWRAGGDVRPYLHEAFPQAGYFQPVGNGYYQAWESQSRETLLGYVTVGSANGYGGPMQVAVAVDLEGQVLGLSVVRQKETPAWMQRVLKSDLFDSLIGKSYADAFELGDDVDGVSGATYTSRAIVEVVQEGSREIVGSQLGLPVPVQDKPRIILGIPEITLILLFAAGYIGHQQHFKYKKQIRWVSMLVGLIVLGFVYNNPLTIAFINKLLMGYFPDWHTSLYWYLLLGGILFVYTVDNKNPYCEWFCPFGAAQECMGAIGGAKVRTLAEYRTTLVWIQRGLAWLAIVVALLFRNPGISSYEVFGTLFSLIGSGFQFILLGIILVAALFLKRPWCSYLCPLRPVTDLIRLVRKWVIETWQKRNLKPVA
jgi:NosR/NirI family nitrous oxide reductase transcriptional regulator